MPTILDAARRYVAAGLSVIPIRLGGHKSPAVDEWAQYEKRIANEAELIAMFSRNVGLAVIGGSVSGGLEILDFDKPDLFNSWMGDLAELDPGAHELAESLPRVYTPALGMHLYYRCPEIAGNQKLARAKTAFVDCTGKSKTVLIETRGEGGYVLAPPSPAGCHKANRAYEWIGGAKLTEIPTITAAQRDIFFQVARAYNEIATSAPMNSEHHSLHGAGRPGDDYNARGPDWSAILEPAGWTFAGNRGDSERWRRPGKTDGISATTGHCGDKLYVFSSNADPFESERAYDKFAAFCLLNHKGDFAAAAKELAGEGFGEKRTTESPGVGEPPPDDTPHTVAGETKKEQVRILAKPMTLAELLDRWESMGDNQAIPTPIKSLNEILGGGWPVGQVTIIKAYAKVGKSEFCRQSALAAASMGYPIVYVDVELGAARLAERIISQGTNIPATRLRKKSELCATDREKIQAALDTLRPDTLMQFICPGSAVPLEELEQSINQALAANANGKPALLVLDSVQRLAMGAASKESYRMQVTEFMGAVTRAAMNTNTAVILVSEERRSTTGGIPTVAEAMTSGAESRSIEFQSDVMISLYNEDKQDEIGEACAADTVAERRVQLLISTNRNGSGVGYLPESIVFEAPCWGMRIDQRNKADIEDLVLEQLEFGEDSAIAAGKIARSIHRRVDDVKQTCRNLIDAGKLLQKGSGPHKKFYRFSLGGSVARKTELTHRDTEGKSKILPIPNTGSVTFELPIPRPGSVENA